MWQPFESFSKKSADGYRVFLIWLFKLVGAAAAPTLRLGLAASLAFCRRVLRVSSRGLAGCGVVASSAWILVRKLGMRVFSTEKFHLLKW